MKLKIAEDLSLPVDVVTQKLGWIGTTGSGKTYGASKLAELMWDAHAQFIVLDPVGVWYGLRLAKDGKKPSDITIPIFGGLHGDVPLEPTGGALLADLVVDRSLSAIIDVSQFESDAQKARFAADFADRLFFRKKASPSALHLFIEECQEFVPENQQRGEERMLHVFVRLQKIGRNFGIGTSLITQRPQEVAKKALNLAQTLFVFRTTGSHERGAIERWIKDKAIAGQDISAELPKLKTGAPHVWSPEWLDLSRVVHVVEKRTFNASATPEVGAARVTRELAPIDLAKIRDQMAATIEKAKADDPRELKKQIAELKRDLAARNKTLDQVDVETKRIEEKLAKVKPVEKFILTDGDRALLAKTGTMLEQMAGAMGVRREELVEHVSQRIAAESEKSQKAFAGLLEGKGFQRILSKLAAVPPHPHIPTTTQQRLPQPPLGRLDESPGRRAVPGVTATRPAPGKRDAASNGDLTPAKQKILNALAFLHGIGIQAPDREQTAFLANTSPSGGSYKNNVSALRTAGLIDYPTDGVLALTDAGSALAATDGVPTTTEDLHATILAKLPPARQKILRALLDAYPEPLTRHDLAEAINTSAEGGSYKNNISAMRTAGLLDYPRDGQVVATSVLFLEA